MIFFIKHGGQLCNRLWALYPAYTFARARRKRLHVLFADPGYLTLFPNVGESKGVKFWFTRKFWHKVRFMNWIENILDGREIHGELRDYSDMGGQISAIQSINGWEHHSDISYSDNLAFRESFVRTFAFDSKVHEHVLGVMSGFGGKTIGIHARRGDYRQWKDGRYCYDDAVWARIMHALQEQFEASGVLCRFLICSNEAWTFRDESLDMFQIPGADGITDLCALSRCDYIIGPPSTYSQWASFVGGVPLHFILAPDESVDMDDFSPVIRQDVFADGKTLQWDEVRNLFVLA